jgi:hypothetical protein
MFILARGGQTYCRLEYHTRPVAGFELGVEVDYDEPFGASDHAAWETEYRANVHELVWETTPPKTAANGDTQPGPVIVSDPGSTSPPHDRWLDERQRRWEEELAWEEYMYQFDEEPDYDRSYD